MKLVYRNRFLKILWQTDLGIVYIVMNALNPKLTWFVVHLVNKQEENWCV